MAPSPHSRSRGPRVSPRQSLRAASIPTRAVKASPSAHASAPQSSDFEARVILRLPVESDRRAYIALRRSSAAFLRPWEPLTPQGKVPAPGRVFGRILKTADIPTTRRLLVCARETGEIMGQVSLSQIFRGPFQNAIMGYWLGKRFAGRGYMTETLILALDMAFGPMKLHRVEANLMPRNASSRALAKRVGMRFEGLATRYLQIGGVWEDHEHWAMTAEEWPQRRAAAIAALRGRHAGMNATSRRPAARQKRARTPAKPRPRTLRTMHG